MASKDPNAEEDAFRPALLVVDMQEDFCPPNGSLAVPGGRDITPTINALLDLPFTLKIGTKDWHPPDHISFASNHAPPNNQPFTSFTTIRNPEPRPDPASVDVASKHEYTETCRIRLWPTHCVQNTPGASLIPELATSRLDRVLEKGQDARVEMYSAFSDAFGDTTSSGLAALLQRARVSHVYVTGLAADYCVLWTAVDACRAGFRTLVVEEAMRAVDPGDEGMGRARREWAALGVGVIRVDGEEVDRVRRLTGKG